MKSIGIDWWTLLIYILLVFFGWVNIYAADYLENTPAFLDLFSASTKPRYFTQLIWFIISLFVALVIMLIDSRFYAAFAYPLYGFLMFLLLAVLLFGKEIHGARSWLQIGGFQFQPAEFAKFATCLALAKYVGRFGFDISKRKDFLRLSAIILFPLLLIVIQNDAGSAVIYLSFIILFYREGFSPLLLIIAFILIILSIFTIIWGKLTVLILICCLAFMFFSLLSKKRKHTLYAFLIIVTCFALAWGILKQTNPRLDWYYVLLLGLVPVLFFYLYYLFRKEIRNGILLLVSVLIAISYTYSTEYIFTNILRNHHQERILQILGKTQESYNVRQSKIAIGSGGVTGKGFLKGTQTKLKFVPEQETDFIFCTVGEEWGFIGSLIVISLFGALILRIIFLGERQRSRISRAYAYGVAGIFFFHFMINVGMTVGLLPVIGIPLPFFSYGGSSLLAFTILLFILLRLDMNRLELVR